MTLPLSTSDDGLNVKGFSQKTAPPILPLRPFSLDARVQHDPRQGDDMSFSTLSDDIPLFPAHLRSEALHLTLFSFLVYVSAVELHLTQ